MRARADKKEGLRKHLQIAIFSELQRKLSFRRETVSYLIPTFPSFLQLLEKDKDGRRQSRGSRLWQ